MADELDQTDGTGGRRQTARRMAERAIQAQAAGDDEQADDLFAQASRIDPDAVAAALAEHATDRPVATAPSPTGPGVAVDDDAEVASISRQTEAGADAPPRSGITGSGSGADGQGT